MVGESVEIGLLHSRFPVYRRQELEEYWMDKLGKAGKNRSGCILFSTQIVEQSVDLDADFMVTELAPTDMLLQRMGRLCRHERGKRFPEMWIVAEGFSYEEFKNSTAQKIKKMFGIKAIVYSPYVLLRSLEVWKETPLIELPGDIRLLLETTYKEKDNEPASWLTLRQEIEGEKFALKMAAQFETNIWNLALDDEEGKARTRVNSLETTQLVLCVKQTVGGLKLLNGEAISLSGEKFNLTEARAVAKNIAKVPKYCFENETQPLNKKLCSLIRGNWKIGFVEGENIKSTYLKSAYKMRYTPEKGVEIMKTDQENEVNNEPCD
jgi:CRISPR-associated endonuclease/helicase Cas3